jgi:hypothetical protein
MFNPLCKTAGELIVNGFVVRLYIDIVMAIEIVISAVDRSNLHRINSHVGTTGASADVGSVLYQLNHTANLGRMRRVIN